MSVGAASSRITSSQRIIGTPSSTSSETGEFVPIELCLELFTGGMDAAHHCADRDVLCFGDFSVTQAQFSKQDKSTADGLAQAVEGTVKGNAKILLM